MDPTSNGKKSRDEGDEMSSPGQGDVVLAAGGNPGETVSIPAELLPPEYREDGRLRMVASVDREGILDEA